MNCLSLDLLSEVLTLLPAKDLLKLRVVCKSWNSIICDPRFHQHHLHQLRKNNIQGCKYYISIISPYKSDSEAYFNSVDIRNGSSFAIIEEIELIKPHCYRGLNSIKGCVDGVLLACTVSHLGDNNYVTEIFLWNPTLRKAVDIPLYEPSKKIITYYVGFGFGFDTASNIYKVVAIELKNDLKMMVYNLGSRSWTSPKFDRGLIHNVKQLCRDSRSINFEGCIYWLAIVQIAEYYMIHCLCFNISTEALSCAELSDAKLDNGKMKYSTRRVLAVLYESLAVVDEYQDHICVWVRRKESRTSSVFAWIELCNVDCGFDSLLYLTNDGNLYLQSWSLDPKISVCDLKLVRKRLAHRNQLGRI